MCYYLCNWKHKQNLYISKSGLRLSSITRSVLCFLVVKDDFLIAEFCFRNSNETWCFSKPFILPDSDQANNNPCQLQSKKVMLHFQLNDSVPCGVETTVMSHINTYRELGYSNSFHFFTEDSLGQLDLWSHNKILTMSVVELHSFRFLALSLLLVFTAVQNALLCTCPQL